MPLILVIIINNNANTTTNNNDSTNHNSNDNLVLKWCNAKYRVLYVVEYKGERVAVESTALCHFLYKFFLLKL